MYAGFSAQQAKSVFAFNLDGRALDARRVASSFVFNRGFEALALGILQVFVGEFVAWPATLGKTGFGGRFEGPEKSGISPLRGVVIPRI